jgi:CheY-like chemotaxis protein
MSKTLLLADDSVTIQKVVGISFANEDVRIVTVDNGDDAVVRAREIKPDIVLADVVMPGKSGYDVCASLKGDPELRGIPVLLLTGTFETFDEERATRAGADGHITKPFEAQALVELVNARLAGAAAARTKKPAAPAAPAPAPAAASPAKAAAEPEPFDFLEAETGSAARPSGAGTAQPVARPSDAFSFESEPIDARELQNEEDAALELGNEATEARTTLLLDEEPFADADTAPPMGFSARDFEPEDLGEPAPAKSQTQPHPTPPPTRAEARPAAGDPLEGVFDPLLDEAGAAPRGSRAFDVAAPDLEDPRRTRVLQAEEGTGQPRFAEPLFDDDGSPGEFDLPAPAGAAPMSRAAGEAPTPVPSANVELTPELRGQLHETLEKVAWEAFGDLSERIVREAVQRVEQVAWDVIPRLAETLIREEIRRLKGED